MSVVSRETLTRGSGSDKKDPNALQSEEQFLEFIQGHLRNGSPMAIELVRRAVAKRRNQIKELKNADKDRD